VIGTDFTGSWKSNYHTITASIVGKYFINTVFHIFLDDLDEKTRRNSDYDENGNPLDRYLQMRGSPKLSSGSSVIRKNYPGAASSAFPSHFKDFGPYSLGGTPINELDGSSYHQSHEASRAEKKLRKKIKKEKVSYSQEIENYVGNKEIDELLDFIESDKNGRKPKKNSQTISNDIAVVSKSTEKNNKKNKDRKLIKSANDEKCEPSEKEDASEAKITDETTPLINSQKTEFTDYKSNSIENHNVEKVCVPNESHLNNSINRMGNTTAKNSSNENTEFHKQMNEEKETEKEEIKQPSTPIENIVVETKSEIKQSENLTNGTEKQIKKDKKTLKSVDKHNQSNKVKPKEMNPKAENIIMNGVDTVLLLENNSIEPKLQSINDKHRNAEKSANKELSSGDHDHSLNGMVSKDMNALLLLNELDLVQNEDYRFTDFEPLRKEPEFTVVGKKKKKPTSTKEVITSAKETLIPPKPAKREERRKAPRSVTPPPLNKLSSNIEGERTRDLSPSAFPALGSANQPSFRDARRNSTGDVRMEVQSIIKAQDDSDIESVKSLPASSQGVWGQNSLSPRLPVSYAKMAASPKPSVNSLESSTTEEDPGDPGMDLKAANWKGQIKERRHSIGSHPENVKESESSSMKQKFGSQEVLNVCDQDVVLIDSDYPKVEFGDGFENESNSMKNEENNPSLCSSVSFVDNNLNDTNIIINSHSTSLNCKSVSNSEPAKQTNQDDEECFHETDKLSESSYKVSNPRKNFETNNVEKVKSTKQTLNNSKKVKQSVIFMDKRVSQTPKNLGISFFFDSENESNVTGVELENLQKCSSSNLQNSPNNIPKSSDSKKLSRTSDNASVIDSTSISISNNEQGADFLSKSHPLTGKNGVVDRIINPNVQNKHHLHNDDAIIFISEHNQFLDAIPISNDSQLLNDSKQHVSQHSVGPDNLVCVTIGDRIHVEPNSLPKDVRCKQQVFYCHNLDASCNQRFNFPEAVGYLSRG
jgi:hypothetical protein